MPQVKLKIEVNGGTTASGFNVSADKSANNVGFSSMPLSFDDSFKGTRLLTLSARTDANKTIFINSQGYLVNNQDDEEAGQLQSEQNKRQFIYGKTDENGEYELTLTMTTDTGTFDRIVVVGDSVGNQFPTEAVVDGATTIYSDDPYWAIDLGDKQSSHTIKFTKWNKANYNACFNQVKIMLQYYEVDRFNGLKQVESLSQSTPDASSIYYGTLANSGSAEIVDVDGEIEDMINDGILDNSNVPIELYIDNHLVQSHITNDSDYTPDKILNLQFTNKIENWDTISYGGYPYPDEPKTAYEMLYNVLSGLGGLQPVDDMLSEEIVYGDTPVFGTVKSYLEAITIPYPYLPSDTYRNTIDKFCRLAQLQCFQKDDGTIKFVSARPIVTSLQADDAIIVPKYAQIDNLKKTIVLKNKYDAVEIQNTQVNDIIDYDTLVHNDIVYNFDDIETNNKNGSAGQSKSYASSVYIAPDPLSPFPSSPYWENVERITCSYIENKYTSGTIEIDATNKSCLERIQQIYNYSNGGLKFSVTYKKKQKYISKSYSFSSGTQTNNSFSFDMSSVDWSSADESIETGSMLLEISTNYSADVDTSATLTNKNSATITYDDVNDKYIINYTLLVCSNTYSVSGGDTTTSQSAPSSYSAIAGGLVTKTEPLEINISLYGDKRVITFETISASDDTSSAKTIATVQGSELLQTGTKYNNSKVMSTLIKDNIKSDYANGLSNGDIELFCLDYYDANNNKIIDFNNGEVLEINKIISIEGDTKLWKTTGRQLKYDGQNTVNTEVEEVKTVKTWNDCFTYQAITSGGEITGYKITGMTDLIDGDVVVPSSYNGKPVTQIEGIRDFDRKEEIITVNLPNTIKRINDYAFLRCTNLESINLPYGITYIGMSAFGRCESLSSISLPNSITSFGYAPFSYCPFTTIELPNSITKISNGLLENLSSLVSVSIPDTITKIEDMAFYGCSSLQNVTLPSALTYIGQKAFEGCVSLTTLDIPSSVNAIYEMCFAGCIGLTTININYDNIAYRMLSYNSYLSDGRGSPFNDCSSSLKIHILSSILNPADIFGTYFNYYSISGQLTYVKDL